MTLGPRLRAQLDQLRWRLDELNAWLSRPETAQDPARLQQLSREHGEIAEVAEIYGHYLRREQELAEAERMATAEADPDLRALAVEEAANARREIQEFAERLRILLLPKDPNDERSVFLEIRAGTGGEEAALFATDLARMYTRYGETQGWTVAVVSASESELGGYKEVILEIAGRGAYSRLKFESGGHRVQRVPETEAQGRIHTSACTVAVLPEADEVTAVEINPAELRIDTFRASGAGGQHVNKTDSAVRITHLPTGMVVSCQEDRSQHKNRARAMSLLKARLLEREQERHAATEAQTRRLLVGSGGRSERIRTYNFPQGRVTDHRINLTLYRLDEVMAGNLDILIEPLIREYQADLLARLGEDA